MTTHTTDLLIVGAGPTGLFAAYYAGFRGLSVTVLDSLPELGGQITAMYPEKQIHDVAGFPSVKGRDLVTGLVNQADSAQPTYLLEQAAATLEPGEDEVTVGLEDGTRITAGAVLVTAGIGRFEPRPLPAGEDWIGRGMEFFIPSFEPYKDKDVVIVGGGDSAFDWAVQLEPVARSVTLVHRRDRFRAHEATVNELRATPAHIITSAQVTEFHGTEQLTSVTIAQGEESFDLPCDAVVAALGFIADLGPLQDWGMEVHKRHILVDPAMRTSVHRVFAAGDITDYEGKVRLIAVGFGEAATAVNNAAVVLDPGSKVFPGHSSDGG